MMTMEMVKNTTVLLFLLETKLLVRMRLIETSRPATPKDQTEDVLVEQCLGVVGMEKHVSP